MAIVRFHGTYAAAAWERPVTCPHVAAAIADRRHGLGKLCARMFVCELVQVTNTQRQSHPLGNHTRNLGRNLCTEQVAGTRELRLQRWQGGALQNSERPAFLYPIPHADRAEPRDNPVPHRMKLLMPCVLAAICECHNGKRSETFRCLSWDNPILTLGSGSIASCTQAASGSGT
jgi:hypothetical protein